jgi:hypothetical protein
VAAVLEDLVPAVATPRRDVSRGVAVAVLTFVVVVFLAQAAPRISAPFGESHEGRNSAVWALGSRAMREDGLLESRFGARASERGVYANHPPGILLETYVAERLLGVRPLTTRVPAWAGSAVAIVGLYALARACALRRASAIVGTMVATGSAMFLVYGGMLNMEAISLPWGIAFLVAVRRAEDRPVSPAVTAALAAGAVLTSYQGVVLVGATVLYWMWSWRRRPRRAHEVPVAAVGVACLVVYASWVAWSTGDLADIVDQFLVRSGDSVATGAWFDRQLDVLLRTFPVWTLLALPFFLVVAWRDRRTRVVTALGVLTCAVMVFGLRQGAYIHDYWNHWLVVPLAVAAAAACDALLERADAGRSIAAPRLVLAVAAIALVGAVAIGSPVDDEVDRGHDAGEVAMATVLRPGQDTAYVYPGTPGPASYYAYVLRLPSAPLLDRDAVAALVATQPDVAVLISRQVLEYVGQGEHWDAMAARATILRPNALSIEAGALLDVLGDS